MKYLLILTFILGCSSLSQEDCQGMNWQDRGQRDALNGFNSPRHKTYSKTCAEYGLKVDQKKYLSGYKSGLKLFCTHKNGYDLGLKGSSSHLYCEKLSPEFKKAYKQGYQKHLINKEKEVAKNELRDQLLEINGGQNPQECSTDYDCQKETSCNFGKCSHNQKSCSFNSDCKIEGICVPSTGQTRFGDLVTVNTCRYTRIY